MKEIKNTLSPGALGDVWNCLIPFHSMYCTPETNIYLFVYLRKKEREGGRVNRGRSKGRGTKRFGTECEPDSGLDLTTPRSQPELKLRVKILTD